MAGGGVGETALLAQLGGLMAMPSTAAGVGTAAGIGGGLGSLLTGANIMTALGGASLLKQLTQRNPPPGLQRPGMPPPAGGAMPPTALAQLVALQQGQGGSPSPDMDALLRRLLAQRRGMA